MSLQFAILQDVSKLQSYRMSPNCKLSDDNVSLQIADVWECLQFETDQNELVTNLCLQFANPVILPKMQLPCLI